ncbi:MAG TPA: hypothetical protein VM537_26075 [Anaerolineae bacterium]|nr:hypothetical protein [Anaerolineae bacterium]
MEQCTVCKRVGPSNTMAIYSLRVGPKVSAMRFVCAGCMGEMATVNGYLVGVPTAWDPAQFGLIEQRDRGKP